MLGIITEYNPFHNGHKIHIEKSKIATSSKHCIVVMSGNFCQRGEPAIIDKYYRTKMALLNGADIVLELPVGFATSSAELFSLGAVDILNKTNIVKSICFGSEEGNLDTFFEISKILVEEPPIYKNYLQQFLQTGISFPNARLKSLEAILNKHLDFLAQPNNILSLEYLKAINFLNSKINVKTIKRENAHFHCEKIQGNVASATAIRKALYQNDINSVKNAIPENCFDIIKNINYENLASINNYTQILHYILKTSSIDNLKNIADVTEGIENKIIDNIGFKSINELILNIKSKRYTYTKLSRAILHIILNITKEEQKDLKQNLNPYIRVLGFKKSSSHILTKLSKEASVPVITNLKNAHKILNKRGMYYLQKEILYSDIYYLYNKKNIEYKKQLVII